MTDKQQAPSYRLAFDLEMNQPSGRIIAIGAVVGDVTTGMVVDRMNQIVDPREPLSEMIIKLTGITEARVAAEGVPLLDAYQALVDIHHKWNCEPIPLIWNANRRGNDVLELLEQVTAAGFALGDNEANFIFHNWRDVKALFQEYCAANGMSPRSGLAKSLLRVGIAFDGRTHDAGDDALNTFRMAHFINRLLVDPQAVFGRGRDVPPPQKKERAPRKSQERVAVELAQKISRELTTTAELGEGRLFPARADGLDVVITTGVGERRLSLAEAGKALKAVRDGEPGAVEFFRGGDDAQVHPEVKSVKGGN